MEDETQTVDPDDWLDIALNAKIDEGDSGMEVAVKTKAEIEALAAAGYYLRKKPTVINLNMAGIKYRGAMVKKVQAKSRRSRRVIVDSGASVNVAGTKGRFGNIKPKAHSYNLESASRQGMSIDKYGHVPGVGMTVESVDTDDDILSVFQLTEEVPGLEVTFSRGKMVITHPFLDSPIYGIITGSNLYSLKDSDVSLLLNARQRVWQACPVHLSEVPTPVGAPEQDQTPVETGGDKADPATVAGQEAEPVKDVPVSAPEPARVQATGENTASGLRPEEVRRAKELRFLHNTLGHPGDAQLISALKNGIILGTHLTARDVENANLHLGACQSCKNAKATRPTYTVSQTDLPTHVGHKVYADIFMLDTPKNDATVKGACTMMLAAVDGFSSMMHVFPLKTKHARELCNALVELYAAYHTFGHKISQLHTDEESALTACSVFLGTKGVEHLTTEPDQHCQRIERFTRTVGQRKKAIRFASPTEIPLGLDQELTRTAVYHLNDMPNSSNKTESPRMIFEGKKLDLTKRQQVPFGTAVNVRFPQDKDSGPQLRLGVCLGPAPQSYGSNNCYVFNTKEIVTRGRGMEPLPVIPENFPWKVKTGIENFTVSRPTGKKGGRKTTAISMPGAVKAQAQLDQAGLGGIPTAVGDKIKDKAESVTPFGGESGHIHDAMGQAAFNVLPLIQPQKEAAFTLSRRAEADLEKQRHELERTSLKRQQMDEDIETLKRLKTIATLRAEIGQVTSSAARQAAAELDAAAPVREPTVVGKKPAEPKATRQMSEGSKNQKNRKQEKKANLQPTPTMVTRKQQRITVKKLALAVRKYGSQKAKDFLRLYKISVKESLGGEHAQESREAINQEILNMLDYKVGHYKHYRDIPEDKRKNILQTFMFLKHKTTPDGLYDKTKARMVGNGATQKAHMYDLVSSSTVALSSVFLLCNLASHYRANLTTYDIKGAFLHAKFGPKDEVTYIRINKEITDLWVVQDPSSLPYVDDRGTLLLELDKFIYGLKQSPLKFQMHLINVLTNLGYKQSSQDSCVFVRHEGKDFSVLSIHVDDIMQVATNQSLYDELKDGLVAEFTDITTTVDGNAYLGMSIERDPEDRRKIKLSQRGLIDKIVGQYPKAPGDRHRHHSPADDHLFDVNPSGERLASAEEKTEFLSVLMTLMYVARLTRPDILLPVTFLAGRTHCADLRDIRHLERVIRYLEGTSDLGVHLNCTSLQLHCSCDASFAVHSPALQTKGHTGFIIGFGPEMSYLHGRSGKQKTASTSSCDAEIIALCEATKMCIWIRNIMSELQITPMEPIVIYQDNQSAIKMCTNETLMGKSKHLLTKMTYVRDYTLSGAVALEYIPTAEMTADVLTKALHGAPFDKHVTQMMGLKWSKYLETEPYDNLFVVNLVVAFAREEMERDRR